MKEQDKARFLKSKDGKDVVIKLSNYDSKLKCNDRVMYELDQEVDVPETDKHYPIIAHVTMNNWAVYVEDHLTINLHYIDWIAVQTNYGIHVIQIGPQKKPIAFFNLTKGEAIDKVFVYCNKEGLFTRTYVEGSGIKFNKELLKGTTEENN